jgi:hypothetical protein
MRVIFALPALTNTVHLQCMKSLMMAQRMLDLKGIQHEMFTVCNCPVISVARNSLAAMFMQDPEATDLFFIDSDVGFDPAGVLAILDRPEDIVAGIYPLKRDAGGFPVQIKTQDGVPVGRDGLIEALMLPGGFMRIKRSVFEKMAEAYPESKYDDDFILIEGSDLKGAYDFFGFGIYGNVLRTEDFAFCERWRQIGGRLWVYPNVDFEHVGQKAYSANYHEYLLGLPGGRNSNIGKAAQIDGWMSIPELSWLAAQASMHSRIYEIGSWKGRSTRALADNTHGFVWAVDTWQGSAEHQGMADLEDDALFGAFKANVADLTNVVDIRHESLMAAENVAETGPRPDMVFIDGSHDYENVKADIQAWKPLLMKDGLLCGHDYSWPGVRQAVDELLPGAKVAPGTDIWFWREPDGLPSAADLDAVESEKELR